MDATEKALVVVRMLWFTALWLELLEDCQDA